MSDGPEEIMRRFDELMASPDPDDALRESTRKMQEEREAQQAALADKLQKQREADPAYWKRLYENLSAKIEEEREARERQRAVFSGGVLVTAAVAVVWLIIDRLI